MPTINQLISTERQKIEKKNKITGYDELSSKEEGFAQGFNNNS
jgi:hypothetical protein